MTAGPGGRHLTGPGRTIAPESGIKGTMLHSRRTLGFVMLAGIVAAGCSQGFQTRKFPTSASLWTASMAEFKKKNWDNAVTGFERLTLDLSARDSLLPRAHYYLGESYANRGDYLLSAQSFNRLAESFPDDTLADDALFSAGQSYGKLWKDPQLDPTYGDLSQSQFRLLVSLYPESPLREKADKALLGIDEMKASKDYETGMHYVRRRAFDSAIIYFKDVVRNFPATQKSRDAMLRMVEVYQRPEMNYKEEAKEMCTALEGAYPGDKDVSRLCPSDAAVSDSTKAPSKGSKPAAKPAGKPGEKPAEAPVQTPGATPGAPRASARGSPDPMRR
jgi:outer membrane protein assembly factor BamD